MDQAQEISNKIIQLVRDAPGGVLSGIRLGASIRAFFPTFQPYSYRCRNLRHFIQKCAPTVTRNVLSTTTSNRWTIKYTRLGQRELRIRAPLLTAMSLTRYLLTRQ